MTLEQKFFRGLRVKSEPEGIVSAIVATPGAVDHDREIIEPGAIERARAAVSDWGHNSLRDKQPVGVADVRPEKGRVVADIRLFMGTQRGRDTFEVLREMGELQEFSIGFRTLAERPPTDAERQRGAVRVLTKLQVIELSLVLQGAQPGTGTVSVREREQKAELRRIAEDFHTRSALWRRMGILK